MTTARRPTAVVLAAVFAVFSSLVAIPRVDAQLAPLEETRPNVLLIVTDDQRLDGTMAVLPTVREWFGAGGTEFTNAYVTTPLCCPSRASIMTGRYTHNHGVEANGEDAAHTMDHRTTLASQLQRAGYSTAIFGKFFNKWPHTTPPPGYDEWAIQNFRYSGSTFNVNGRAKVIDEYSTDYITEKSTEFIEGASAAKKPWFLYIAPMAAHSPFEPSWRYRDAPVPAWGGNPATAESNRKDKPLWVRNESTSHARGDKLRRLQLRTLMSVDDLVDDVVETLEETGEDTTTIAVFTSDNGFFWGEHGLEDKRGAYVQALQVPLYLRWPGRVLGGTTDDRIAANIDIAPTLLSAAGVEPSHSVDGTSLLESSERDHLLIEYFQDEAPFDDVPKWAGIFTPQHEYVEYYGKKGGLVFREYYDLTRDPWQLSNLLGDSSSANDPSPDVLRELKTRLHADMNCTGTACP
ncbi:MAG TPA: sulfatase [Actinomycetota bacterium]|nr:sulfatase [Actinomycetota bacterium]